MGTGSASRSPDPTVATTSPEFAPTDLATAAGDTDAEAPKRSTTTGPSPAPSATTAPTPYPLLEADTALPAAPIGLDAIDASTSVGPLPVSLRIIDIGVSDAAVVSVGVNPDESFEVPAADQVGWYRFGPSPGAEGSAVLAAHIAFDGVDGVFRHLVDVEVGAIVEIGFDNDSSQQYRITEVTDYLKQELPASLWAKDGDPQLALITCGGTFNPELSSYESNIVAIAVPI